MSRLRSLSLAAAAAREIPDQYLQEAMQTCRDSALGNEVGSFTTCATLLFAAIGVMNRMRFSSDAPIQKGLGMVTDTWGR